MVNIIESLKGLLSRARLTQNSTKSSAPTTIAGRPQQIEGDRAPYPHCDALILHMPGQCVVCDKFPDYQYDRIMDRRNFTGEYEDYKEPDPATKKRSLDTINQWPGNRPLTEEDMRQVRWF